MYIDRKTFDRIASDIKSYARPLDRYIFLSHFFNAPQKDILSELRRYQNSDGGFGRGIEPDFALPLSSPMATTKAFQVLESLDLPEKDISFMARDAIRYLEKTFDQKRNGWYAVPQEVNDYPHAPWWHYDTSKGMCVIDEHWGNPSAEILAYLHTYRRYVQQLDINKLFEHAATHLRSITHFVSFHEIYCYQRLYHTMPDTYGSRLEDSLSRAIPALVNTDPTTWNEYGARPLDFVQSPEQNRFGICETDIETNLNYLVKTLVRDHKVSPNWDWGGAYEDVWEHAKTAWTGTLTLDALIILDAFGRIRR